MTSLAFDTSAFPRLRGKVALITGGSSGIGLATAKLFSLQGASVVIADLQEPLEKIPGSVFAPCNVTVWADVVAAFDVAIRSFGIVDIVVANAGIGEREDIFVDEYDNEGQLKEPLYSVVDINLKGVLNSVKLAISHFRKGGRGGRIVMTSSTAGYMSETHLPVYSEAKHAVSPFSTSINTRLHHL